MAYRKRYYKADVREPYQGNTLPIKVELRLHETGKIEVVIVNPEGMRYSAAEITHEMFTQ